MKLFEINLPGADKRMQEPSEDLFAPLNPQEGEIKYEIPRRMTPGLVEAIPTPTRDDARALDLGCGDGRHSEMLEAEGFEWVGVDVVPEAPITADAHELPFTNDSFELALALAVFEHLHDPWTAAKEIRRVLKPGGTLVGTVAFLEPFHSNSYYHHSHIGIYRTLTQAGLHAEHIVPLSDTRYTNRDGWRALQALGTMGLFPRMPSPLLDVLLAPVYLLHKLWYVIGGVVDKRARSRDLDLMLAGAFGFVATNPES